MRHGEALIVGCAHALRHESKPGRHGKASGELLLPRNGQVSEGQTLGLSGFQACCGDSPFSAGDPQLSIPTAQVLDQTLLPRDPSGWSFGPSSSPSAMPSPLCT